jgi:DNA (cytosine-5)-methyltransferase 1
VDTCESLIPQISPALKARDYKGPSSDGDGDGAPFIVHPAAHAFDARQSSVIQYGDKTGPLDTDGHSMAVAFDLAQITSAANRTRVAPGLPASTLNASGQMHVAQPMAVRRLTPKECERLQGFPDDYTQIPYRNKPATDGPRYKALGNSMAVPVMGWIGRRLQVVSQA